MNQRYSQNISHVSVDVTLMVRNVTRDRKKPIKYCVCKEDNVWNSNSCVCESDKDCDIDK